MPKTASVTGASRGIGRATAMALAKKGHDVVITARTVHEGDVANRPEADSGHSPRVGAGGGSQDGFCS